MPSFVVRVLLPRICSCSFINLTGSPALADYWLVKNRAIDVPQLYDQKGIYYYTWGFNWRAVVACVVAIAPNVPGMAHALNSSVNIGGSKWIVSIFSHLMKP